MQPQYLNENTSMKVPMWLLRLVMSYLEHRKMILRFRGCSSDPEDMPGDIRHGILHERASIARGGILPDCGRTCGIPKN